jgi:hypothetical protein
MPWLRISPAQTPLEALDPWLKSPNVELFIPWLMVSDAASPALIPNPITNGTPKRSLRIFNSKDLHDIGKLARAASARTNTATPCGGE